jgi:hypothetical protein
MFIYLDYAAVFPYTGGEIVYVRHRSVFSSTSLMDFYHRSTKSHLRITLPPLPLFELLNFRQVV